MGLVVALLTLLPVGALAQDRYALIIGQDAYQNVEPLHKAVNDARAVGQALQKLGFTVSLGENLTRRDFVLRMSEFENRIRPGDTAFVYYAGHGVEIEGANYILPVDVPKVAAQQLGILKDESISTIALVERLKARGTRAQVVILDACRDNPFRDTNGRSLGNTQSVARAEVGQGVFVIYSAGVGETALDRLSDTDPDPNSVFTRTLVQLIGNPDFTLVELAKETRTKVKALAASVGHRQTPSYYDEVDGDLYLAKLGGGALITSREQPAPFEPAQGGAQQNAQPQQNVQPQQVPRVPQQQVPQQQGQLFANAPAGQQLGRPLAPPAGFIFPDSDRRILSGADVARLAPDQLRIARNEIYARKGRFFKDQQLAAYFGQFSWYRPHTWNVTLNQVENANVRYLQSLENSGAR